MKKTYIIPQTEVFEVEINDIIANSYENPGIGDGSVGENEVLGRENHNTNPSRPNIWEQGW